TPVRGAPCPHAASTAAVPTRRRLDHRVEVSTRTSLHPLRVVLGKPGGCAERRVPPRGGPTHCSATARASTHTANDGGTRRWCPVASWYALATASASASPQRLPMNEMLTGVPSDAKPLGTTTAGWPVRFVVSRTLPP